MSSYLFVLSTFTPFLPPYHICLMAHTHNMECVVDAIAQLAAGRLVLALEGGYNLNSISHSMEACVRVMLGDMPPPLIPQKPASSSKSQFLLLCVSVCCIQLSLSSLYAVGCFSLLFINPFIVLLSVVLRTLSEVRRHVLPYWPCLAFINPLPLNLYNSFHPRTCSAPISPPSSNQGSDMFGDSCAFSTALYTDPYTVTSNVTTDPPAEAPEAGKGPSTEMEEKSKHKEEQPATGVSHAPFSPSANAVQQHPSWTSRFVAPVVDTVVSSSPGGSVSPPPTLRVQTGSSGNGRAGSGNKITASPLLSYVRTSPRNITPFTLSPQSQGRVRASAPPAPALQLSEVSTCLNDGTAGVQIEGGNTGTTSQRKSRAPMPPSGSTRGSDYGLGFDAGHCPVRGFSPLEQRARKGVVGVVKPSKVHAGGVGSVSCLRLNGAGVALGTDGISADSGRNLLEDSGFSEDGNVTGGSIVRANSGSSNNEYLLSSQRSSVSPRSRSNSRDDTLGLGGHNSMLSSASSVSPLPLVPVVSTAVNSVLDSNQGVRIPSLSTSSSFDYDFDAVATAISEAQFADSGLDTGMGRAFGSSVHDSDCAGGRDGASGGVTGYTLEMSDEQMNEQRKRKWSEMTPPIPPCDASVEKVYRFGFD